MHKGQGYTNPREHRMAEPHKQEERTQTKCREFPRVSEVRSYVKRPASDIFSTGKCIFYVYTYFVQELN